MISLEYGLTAMILLAVTLPSSFLLADTLNQRLLATESICRTVPSQ